jgi:hypothetical protein
MSDISDVIGDVDLSTVDTSSNFDPIPPAWYGVVVDEAEVKDTKAGNGKYLKLKMIVASGDFANRHLYANITLSNPSSKAVEIGMRDMASIGSALGLKSIKDTTDLVGKTLEVKVIVKPESDDNKAGNEIKGYRACGSAGSAPVAKASPAPAAKAPAAKRPWEK